MNRIGTWWSVFRSWPPLMHWLVIFSIAVLIYIWGVCYYMVEREQADGLRNAYQTTANLARTFREQAEGTLENVDQLTNYIKVSYEAGELNLASLAYLKEKEWLYTIYIFDADGNMLNKEPSSHHTYMRSLLLGHRELHVSLNMGTMFIGHTVWDSQRDRWFLPISRRINRPDGSYAGMVVLLVRPEYFANLYNQLDVDEDSMICLFGRDGNVRSSKFNTGLDAGDSLAGMEIMERLHTADRGSYLQMEQGAEYAFSYESLDRYPLVAAVGVPTATVLRDAHWHIFLYMLLACVLSVVDIAVLVALLRLMVRRLQAEQQLRRAHDGLQKMVDERTQELQQANAQLREMNTSLETVNQHLEEEVTEREQVEAQLRDAGEEIRHIAYYDTSTELPNRFHLIEWLDSELLSDMKQGGGAVLAMDIDNLQMVNDVFGHHYGDMVVQVVASRIRDMQPENAFLAHFGADEFCMVCPGLVQKEMLTEIMDKLLGVIRHEHHFGEVTFHVTASIGAALYPEHGKVAEEILKNADNALLSAKRGGKDQWSIFSEQMRSRLYENVLMTAQMHNALREQEFELYYQPQVDAMTGEVRGFEALIRWNSARLGFVSPGQFIPLAEQNGLIQPIGKWVMEEACHFAKRLENMGYGDVRISVNVSGQQFSRDDFLASACDIMQSAQVRLSQMEIEITESAAMKSLEGAVHKLELLRKMGVRIAIDDFGTGYSSLNYLLRMPFDTLKVDKSFVDMIHQNEKGGKLVRAILLISHILDKCGLAEGVETAEQLEYLRQAGCDIIQGYFFSKPLPEAEALDFLRKHHQRQV